MSYDLYVVTDERLSRGLSHLQIAVQAAQGGADVVQLRDKHLPSKRLYEVAVEIKQALPHSLRGSAVLHDETEKDRRE